MSWQGPVKHQKDIFGVKNVGCYAAPPTHMEKGKTLTKKQTRKSYILKRPLSTLTSFLVEESFCLIRYHHRILTLPPTPCHLQFPQAIIYNVRRRLRWHKIQTIKQINRWVFEQMWSKGRSCVPPSALTCSFLISGYISSNSQLTLCTSANIPIHTAISQAINNKRRFSRRKH